jgi:DMSO/TMAO reductase YedYZ molybdopterin-dependent catalytic subunit
VVYGGGRPAYLFEERAMKSLFRPDTVPDQTLLDDHRPLIRSLERRGLIRGTLSLGALTLLTGCDFETPASVETALRKVSDFNDRVQALIFNPNKLAPTYPASMVLRPPRFNAYYDIMDVKPVDGSTWRLELSGLISDKTPWTVEKISTLPQQDEIIRHICVEGWDYIGEWSGVPLRTFLERVGADTRAKYVNFLTADDYPSSIDMATALHPQTLLATKYAGETLPAPFGYPLRLRTSTKLGFKNPKWITAIEVTNTYTAGYWEKKGFSWFAGI